MFIIDSVSFGVSSVETIAITPGAAFAAARFMLSIRPLAIPAPRMKP